MTRTVPPRTRTSLRLAPKDTGFDAEGRRRSGRVQDRPSYVDGFSQTVSTLRARRVSASAGISTRSPAPPLAGLKRKRDESPTPSQLTGQKWKTGGSPAMSKLAGQKRKRGESPVASRSLLGSIRRRSQSRTRSNSKNLEPKKRRNSSRLTPLSISKTPGPQRRTTMASRRALLSTHWHDSPRSTRASRSFTNVSIFDLAEFGPSLKLESASQKTKANGRARRDLLTKKRGDWDEDDGDSAEAYDPTDADSAGVANEVALQLVLPTKAHRVTAGVTLPTPPSTSESTSEHGLGRSRSASTFDDAVTRPRALRMGAPRALRTVATQTPRTVATRALSWNIR
jgi:hypothetical protein